MEYSLGEEIVADQYHTGVIRGALNRNLPLCYPSIQEEVVQSETVCQHFLTCYVRNFLHTYTDQKAVPTMVTMLHIICREGNRFFVGFPLCRFLPPVTQEFTNSDTVTHRSEP